MRTSNSIMCVSSLSLCEIKSVLDDLIENGDIIIYAFVHRTQSVIVYIDPRKKVDVNGIAFLLGSSEVIECRWEEWCDKIDSYDVISVCISKEYIHTLEV